MANIVNFFVNVKCVLIKIGNFGNYSDEKTTK